MTFVIDNQLTDLLRIFLGISVIFWHLSTFLPIFRKISRFFGANHFGQHEINPHIFCCNA